MSVDGFVIVEKISNRILQFTVTEAGAKLSKNSFERKGKDVFVVPANEYSNPLIEVVNLMNGKPVLIRKSQVGSACDPSTERYWSI